MGNQRKDIPRIVFASTKLQNKSTKTKSSNKSTNKIHLNHQQTLYKMFTTKAMQTVARSALNGQRRNMSQNLGSILNRSSGAKPGAYGPFYSKKNMPTDVYPIVGILATACLFGTYSVYYSSTKPDVRFSKEMRSQIIPTEKAAENQPGHLPLAHFKKIDGAATGHMHINRSDWTVEK